jgi:hypothetical protein
MGMIRPLIGNSYDSITQVEQELKLVTTGVCKFAIESLPLCKGRNTSKRIFKDELKRLDAGRPITGDLYERKKKLKKTVQHRINTLEAMKERR